MVIRIVPEVLVVADSRRSRLARPIVALVACSAICLFIPRPAYAAPGDPTPAASVSGPLGQQILDQEAALESLGQQVQALQQSASADEPATTSAYLAYQGALSQQIAAQQAVDDAAAQTYEQTKALGPYDKYATQLRALDSIVPGLIDAPEDYESLANTLSTAKLATQNAYAAYLAASAQQQSYQDQAATLEQQYTTQATTLDTLKSQNQLAIAQAQEQQDQLDSLIGASLATGVNSRGEAANPEALAALRFALAQIGKPYVFGAEGPDSYDCSGLTWAAYRSAGVTIPRIARYQEHELATEGHTISPSELLPGDLIFFSGTNSSDWTSVSHVAMFYGVDASGTALVVEAPYSGEDVKIAPVWWSHFYAAERVVPAVPAGTSTPVPPASPTPPPTTPPPTTPPPASPSPTVSPSTSPSVSPSVSPSPSDSSSPTDSPSPSESPSPTDSPSPSPSDSTGPSPSPSPSPSDSGSQEPSSPPSDPPPTDPPSSDPPTDEPSTPPSSDAPSSSGSSTTVPSSGS